MSTFIELLEKSQRGDREAAEKLVSENTGLIWSVAKRFVGRGVDLEDLYQLGCVGFLKAIEGFDLGYGTQFSTYAVPKISGEIRRFLRDDGAIKVSRGIKERAALIYNARLELRSTYNREPTVSELSEKTGLSPEDIATADIATSAVESINQDVTEDGFILENVLTDTESEDSLLEKLALRQAIDKLHERESLVIRYRYFHGLTQQQTSRLLSVSQVQVSRIEKKALEHLRELLDS